MDERMELVVAYRAGLFTMTELADRYGVSRKTAYKWVGRVRDEGPRGLEDRSRRPQESPGATAQEIVDRLVAFRRKHPHWGPKKLVTVLQRRDPRTAWPAISTVAIILKRHGLTHGRRRHRATVPDQRQAYVVATAPNRVWTTDFKGQFRTGDGALCYPLTIMDRYSRYLVGCRGLAHPSFALSQSGFERVFREVGLPEWIHSDNGTPFGSPGVARLSRLQVWWLHLGIRPEPIRPAHPDENAEHERMHRTLKAETARPPARTGPGQQRRFDRFREEYNQERPHEGIGMRVPGNLYQPSPRPYPTRLPAIEYPGYFEVRRVSSKGQVSWQGQLVFLSEVLRDEPVGFAEVDDGAWDVYFGPLILGRFDAHLRRFIGTRHVRYATPAAPEASTLQSVGPRPTD